MIKFFVRLENAKKGLATFSGLGIDNEGYYLFYALGDYTGRITDALHNFLEATVYPNLFPYATGTLADLTESGNNVVSQLSVTGTGLQAGTPLYYNAKIKIVTY